MGAENAVLHRHHLQGSQMVAPVCRSGAVGQDEALKPAVIGFTQGGVHANIGGDAGEHQIVYAAGAQNQLQVGRTKRSLAWLVDDDLAVEGAAEAAVALDHDGG